MSLGNSFVRIENHGSSTIEVHLGEGLGPATEVSAGECRRVGLGLAPSTTLRTTAVITRCTPDPEDGCDLTLGPTRYESLVLPTGQTVTVTVGPAYFGPPGDETSTTHAISGTVTGSPMGTAVRLSGTSSASTVTVAGSAFTFPGLSDGWHTVTPALPGYSFTPPYQRVLVRGADVTGVAFQALMAAGTYTISGHVSGAVTDGVTIVLCCAAGRTTTTVGGGGYELCDLPAGHYTITPSRAGYVFAPPSRSVDLGGPPVGAQSFLATAAP